MPSEGRSFMGLGRAHAALTARFRALGASEPRQIREEAALRIPSQVPRFCLARAGDERSSQGHVSTTDARPGSSALLGA